MKAINYTSPHGHNEKMKNQYKFDCGISRYEGKTHFYHSHWHEFLELILVKKGCLKVILRNMSVNLAEGELLAVLPGELHSTESKDNKLLEFVCITFDTRIFINSFYENSEIAVIYSFFSNYQMPGFYLYNSNDVKKGQIPKLMNNILLENKNRKTGYVFSIVTDLAKISLWLLRNHGQNGTSATEAENKVLYARILKLFEIIRAKYNTNISTGEIADMMSMSKSHFCSFFKKVTGSGFRVYLQSQRITEAIKLLYLTDYNVSEIASIVGYNDVNFFVRIFKKQMGIPPLQYRKKYLSSPVVSEE